MWSESDDDESMENSVCDIPNLVVRKSKRIKGLLYMVPKITTVA